MSVYGNNFVTSAKWTNTYPGGSGSSFACLCRVVGADEELALFTTENIVEITFLYVQLNFS